MAVGIYGRARGGRAQTKRVQHDVCVRAVDSRTNGGIYHRGRARTAICYFRGCSGAAEHPNVFTRSRIDDFPTAQLEQHFVTNT